MKLKVHFLYPVFFILGLALVQCSTPEKSKTSTADSKIAPVSNLTHREADDRAKTISKTRYALTFDFENAATSFNATADVRFVMTMPTDTFLDFRDGTIKTLTINGQTKTPNYANNRIYLSKDDTRAGENHIQIVYTKDFSKNGRGIYRFQDPEDNKVYIWTKLQPFDANHVFPCFDQPNLKALISAQITAPKDWKVVFTTMESSTKNSGDKTQWTFPEGPLMSTYLFSIHAGHYEVWRDKYKNIPLRLYTRASLKKYFDAPLWFSLTKQGFGFFEKEFDFPYPFKKYDQLIVPEFSTGGMENIAAVNYNERYIWRGKSSPEEKEGLANILFHEMAHMWFGDLVTNKWWDELWLNESFATFMAFNGVEKATAYKNSWMNFQRRGKLTAYIEDQYPTTHPVSTEVPDIQSTFNHFDAITYSKGASVLRQLSYYLGEDSFRRGVQKYFKDHQYSNTTLSQFVSSLEKVSGSDLRLWSVSWIRNSGVDTLKVTPECDQNHLVRMKFELTPPTPTERSRPHRIPMTYYTLTGNTTKAWTLDDWKSSGQNETQSIMTKAMPCPSFVLPNASDKTYIKLAITNEHVHWAQEHLHKIVDPQARGVFWNQVYLNVRDGNIKIDDFVKLYMTQYEKEKHPVVTQQFFTYWSAIADYLPQKSEPQLIIRTKILETIEKHFWNRITASHDPLWRKTLLMGWIPRVETEFALTQLAGLINQPSILKPLVIDQDIRWLILRRLAALGHPQTEELLAQEKTKDTSETGFKSYLSAQAAKPSLIEKTRWLEEMNRPDSNWNLARKQSILSALFPNTPKQNQLREEYSEQFYKTMSVLDQKNIDVAYNRSYSQLAPASCDENKIRELDSFIEKQNWNVVTKKSLMIQNQENKICARVRSR
ncbi:MAG: aminopeptidase N [Bdellovibrionaceae bacterium]|nr:aminopeptidase N [Pseudobdellovibrionaceae bacterium]